MGVGVGEGEYLILIHVKAYPSRLGPLPALPCVCVLTFFPVQVIPKVVLDSNPP